MRITVIAGPFLPVPPVLGGATEKIIWALGNAWAGAGHDVVVVGRRHATLPPSERQDGVEMRRVASADMSKSRWRNLVTDLLYSLRARRVLPAADVVVTNSVIMPLLLRGHRHGLVCVAVGRYPKGQMRLYRHVARLHVPSSAIRDAVVAQTPGLAPRVRVIGHPLSAGFGGADPAGLSAPRESRLLYVGRVHPEKGLDLLLQAFVDLRAAGAADGWRLSIVGPWQAADGGGGEAYFQALRRLAGPAEAHVDWPGLIFDEERLKAELRRASVFVYPSLAERGETFGLAVLDAMSQACVPVVSALSCFEDFVADGDNGFCFDHRAAAPAAELARVLRRATAADLDLTDMRRRCLETVRDYRVEKIADDYLHDFETLLREHGRAMASGVEHAG